MPRRPSPCRVSHPVARTALRSPCCLLPESTRIFRREVRSAASAFLRPHGVEAGLQRLARHLAIVAELAGAGEPLAAVHGHTVAGLEGAEVREEERREVRDLSLLAEAADGYPRKRRALGLLRRDQTR